MTKSITARPLELSAVPRGLEAVRIGRPPRLGIGRLFADLLHALEAGTEAHHTAHLVAMGLHRPARDDDKDRL